MNLIFVIATTLTVINVVYAIPQRSTRQNIDNPDIQRQIDEVFNQRPTTPRNRGASVIVTPDPNFVPDPTTSPQVLMINQQNCTCVPYHMCDPTTNLVKQVTQADQDAASGFGLIDIRFDPDDCQDVLDVCCSREATSEVSLPPPVTVVDVPRPVPNVAGCGIRNVGGLDFAITGAFVCTLFVVDS